MKIGEIYRASNLPEKQHPSLLEVDGYPNFYYHTAMAGKPKIQFQRGIYSIGSSFLLMVNEFLQLLFPAARTDMEVK